jgi:hypothetical protein
MASNINPANINGQYPIAGQDNDSQGFRDNFTNTRNNLTFAKLEIEDLQDKVILNSPLSGMTEGQWNTQNTLTNVLLSGAKTTGFIESFSPVTLSAHKAIIVFGSGDLQKIDSTNEDFTFEFLNWPTSGLYGKVRVWVNVTNVAHLITFPAEVTVGLGNIVGVVGQVLTPAVGNYLFEFGTIDGGTTVMVVPLITP